MLMCPFLIKEDDERFCWEKSFQYLIFLLFILSILKLLSPLCWSKLIKNCKTSGASPQTPFGWFTAPPTALCDFHFVKIINVLFGFCPSKVWPSDRAAIHIHLFSDQHQFYQFQISLYEIYFIFLWKIVLNVWKDVYIFSKYYKMKCP